MTVTYKGEIPDGRQAQNTKGVRSYSRSFRLTTSLQSEDAYAVGSHASLPVIGSVHPSDAGAWCNELDVNNSDPWKGWIVVASYSAERELAENPLNEPAVITWNSEQFQRPAIFSYDFKAICNSAGDPFDPPNMMDDSRHTAVVSKNVANVPVYVRTYQDAVNSDGFTVDGITVAIGLAKIQALNIGEKQKRNGTAFRVITFTIALNKRGWLLEPLDAGFREKSGTPATKRINIVNDGDSAQPTAAVPLDGAGKYLINPTVVNSVFLSFIVYESKAFSELPLS